MSDADVELIRHANTLVSRGDVAAMGDILHPDVVWEHNLGVGSPEEGTYHGREAVVRLYERIVEPWEYMSAEPDEIRELDDGSYLVTGRLHAKHATSEQVVLAPYEQHLEMRDGLLVRGRMTTGTIGGE